MKSSDGYEREAVTVKVVDEGKLAALPPKAGWSEA